MQTKILLLDGVVVEVKGTAQEIADLTDALRRSPRVAEPGGNRAEPDAQPGPDIESASDLPGSDPEDSPETWEDEEGFDWASVDFDEEKPEIADLPASPEAMPGLANEAPARSDGSSISSSGMRPRNSSSWPTRPGSRSSPCSPTTSTTSGSCARPWGA